MSTFDIRQDAPGLLRAEAVNITLKFDRTGPTTGRVSWNIPAPAAGCTADTRAYAGIVITMDNTPASIDKVPHNGEYYESDPTADKNLFAGDKLGTALVIGSFYEDTTTTFFDVTGLKPNTPYYVSGYPVDAQYRYYHEGTHAYSLDYTNRGTDGTSGTQVVVLNTTASEMGVEPTDFTGLDTATTYTFDMQLGVVPSAMRPVDIVEVSPKAPTYTISVDGSTAQTYQELVDAINVQFALLHNSTQGPLPPNTNGFYFKNGTKQLFKWDGSLHVEVPVILQTTPPNNVVIGSHWYDASTNTYKEWTGTVWNVLTTYEFVNDPTVPVADTSYWHDSANNLLYLWNGNTWCPVNLQAQATDPSLAVEPLGGSYWLNTKNSVLYKWDNRIDIWIATTAIQYHLNPTAPIDGTYWFNETTKQLNVRDAGVWTVLTGAAITEHAPSMPVPDQLWYNPALQELVQRDATNTTWIARDVLLFPIDPTLRQFCDLWLNVDTDVLSVWDGLTSSWTPVTAFYEQEADPSAPPMIEDGSAWLNTTTSGLSIYTNNCFKLTPYISLPTNPTLGVADGSVWKQSATAQFIRTSGVWVAFTPVVSDVDPYIMPIGTMWYDPSTMALTVWNGIAWTTASYSSQPLTPTKGATWFDTSTNTLKVWNGMQYVNATPDATVELNAHGNLLFTHTAVGSTSYIKLKNGDLFGSLAVPAALHNEKPGTDGASSVPSYAELGVGTDGNNAVRELLQTEIRYELGYPVVDVEVTKEQMDFAIDRALSVLRGNSSIAYKRGFFFMRTVANNQKYFLTNKIQGMNKIVDVMGVYRLTSAFLSSAHGAGVYGQIVVQHLYNMGNFDLLSYHITAEYTKLMEMLFAGRITYGWNEQTRELHMHHRFPYDEQMVCIEATVERTEQDLMTDRYIMPWILKYAGAVVRGMLADIRGKFSTLPGASGSVTLNAAEQRQLAKEDIEACMKEIEDFVVDKPDEYGMGSTFTFG